MSLAAPWEATAGGEQANQETQRRPNGRTNALKICKWGRKLAGTKREEFHCLSPFLAAVKPAMPAIGLRLPRRKIERGGQLHIMSAQKGMKK